MEITKNKKIAIVILNWNGSALMEKYLPSVVRYSPAEWADVIVADNGSTDDSLQMLADKFPSVQIIRMDKNYGFAEGYNQALKQISHKQHIDGSYLVIQSATLCPMIGAFSH